MWKLGLSLSAIVLSSPALAQDGYIQWSGDIGQTKVLTDMTEQSARNRGRQKTTRSTSAAARQKCATAKRQAVGGSADQELAGLLKLCARAGY